MAEFLDIGGEWLSLDKIIRVIESARTPGAPYLIVHFQGVAEPVNFDGERARQILEYLNKHRTHCVVPEAPKIELPRPRQQTDVRQAEAIRAGDLMKAQALESR